MYKEEVLERWITWLELDSDGLGEGCAVYLMIRLAMIFLFLVGTREATFAEVCLRLEADCSMSGWTVIITFFIDGDPLQKRTSGGGWKKVEWFPVIGYRFWTILLL